MRGLIACVVVALLVASVSAQGFIKPAKRAQHVTGPLPHQYLASMAALPTNFAWNNINGQSYLTEIRNQHLPQYCGSCWAFAATSAVGDRIKILRQNAWPEYNLAPQVLLNCGTAGTCNGGDSSAAYAYMAQNGLPDETCAPYQAKDLNCTAINICKTCAPDFSNPAKKCVAQTPQRMWKVSQYGVVSGAANMMAEIFARGPISCSMAVTPAFVAYTGGIFKDTTGAMTPDHEISIVGWGVDPSTNTPYWLGRNSWGTSWGWNSGLFQIARGINNCAIEASCSWAVPIIN
jgi:cathepsin X